LVKTIVNKGNSGQSVKLGDFVTVKYYLLHTRQASIRQIAQTKIGGG